jgi:murein L,D-transpeptidase YcbB/YkuD
VRFSQPAFALLNTLVVASNSTTVRGAAMGNRLLPLLLMVATTAGCSGGAERQKQVEGTLRRTLAAQSRPPYVTTDAEGRKLWKLTQQFYERRGHAPAWIKGTKPLPQISELIAALQTATDEGLDPQLYSVALLDQRREEASKGLLTKKGFEPEEAGALDVWLTYLYMKYASDLADGLSDLAHADPKWRIKPEKFDPAGQLEAALRDNKVGASLAGLMPTNPQYQALRRMLADHRAQAAKGGWPQVPAQTKLKPGQRSPVVAAIARRLAASGDFAGTARPAEAAVYTPDLQEAVKRFQRRHGLTDDGMVAAAVTAEMNVPLDHRIRQIEINLERWRWLPRDLGERHILVNIPEYRLEVWDRGQVPVSMRVVVGKQDTQTPIFSDEMTYVVFSPYWNVPPDIAQGETLPEIVRDPGFLARANMEVLDKNGQPIEPSTIDVADPTSYRFRQRPGAQNSLGLVKFMFPNQFNVYLHDTPMDSLFARASRSFSHGCVRLENPMALAEYVLRDHQGWTREKIEEAMQAAEERTVKLKEAIPVHLGYWTARVSGDGVMQFRKDVYGIDGRLTTLLADRLNRLRKSAAAAATAMNRPAGTVNRSSTD